MIRLWQGLCVLVPQSGCDEVYMCRYRDRFGVEVGKTSVLVYAGAMTGRKWVVWIAQPVLTPCCHSDKVPHPILKGKKCMKLEPLLKRWKGWFDDCLLHMCRIATLQLCWMMSSSISHICLDQLTVDLFFFKLHSKAAQYAHKRCNYQSCIKLHIYI